MKMNRKTNSNGISIVVMYQPDGPSGKLANTIIHSANPPSVSALHGYLPSVLNSGVGKNVHYIPKGAIFRSFWFGESDWLREDKVFSSEDNCRTIVSVDANVEKFGIDFITTIIEGTPELTSELCVRKSKENMSEEKLPQIFVSYARPDLSVAKAIAYMLKDAGFMAWFDKECLLGGQDWNLEIKKAIRQSHLFIVCLSSNAVDRKGFYHVETKLALEEVEKLPEESVYILPIRLDDCEIPERIKKWQVIDIFEDEGASLFFRSISTALDVEARGTKEAIVKLGEALHLYKNK